MSSLNPDFWEVPTESNYLENVPESAGIWYPDPINDKHQDAWEDFCGKVLPIIEEMLIKKQLRLTSQQMMVISLYYFHGKTQDDIAVILNLNQSTVSRHLSGTIRKNQKVGGALKKLRGILTGDDCPKEIATALEAFEAQKNVAA